MNQQDDKPQLPPRSTAVAATREARPKVLLLGLPNSGKSQIFNRLTGRYSVVANYPMTTVEPNRKPAWIRGRRYEVIDTPGLHGLRVHSEEELAVRELLYRERPEVIVQCVDANRLKSSLSLTADLLELEVPLVVALNAVDETTRRGVSIDAAALADRLGVAVVELIAAKGVGVGALAGAVAAAAPGRHRKRYSESLERGVAEIAAQLPASTPYPRRTALNLAVGDPFLLDQLCRWQPEVARDVVEEICHRFRHRIGGNPAAIAAAVRNRWIDGIVAEVVTLDPAPRGGFSSLVASISRHPVLGAPILLTLVALCFLLVVNVANGLAGWMNRFLWEPVAAQLTAWLPPGWIYEFFLGDYGVLSFGVANALLTVLPILSVFFLAYGLIEDSGYIPNMSVLTQRALRRLGLSGSSIMPMVLACGCKTMATMTTKVLQSRKERIIAVVLIASSIPCAAQTGLHMAIVGRTGAYAFAVVLVVMVVGFVVGGVGLNRLLPDDRAAHYIQALPPMRLPSVKAVLQKTYYRLLWFCREAIPIFIIAGVVLFLAEKVGLLGSLRVALAPLLQDFLGLPLEMVDVLLLCIARQEAAAALLFAMVDQGRLEPAQTVVAVVLTLRFVPCFNNVVAMVKELGLVTAAIAVVCINTSAFLFAGLVHLFLLHVPL